jgi:hypothetical protein
MNIKGILLGAAATLGLIAAAIAQTTNGPLVPNAPTVSSIGPNDAFQDVVGGFPQAQSYYATASQMGVYGSTLAGGNYDNALIGGDFSTNLFQRGTSVSLTGATYYVAYGADRWFSWGGTSTPATMTQQTGAGDYPVGSNASYRINKGSLTGVLQICTSQIIESGNAARFQGQTAEFTFDAKAGPTFSAASGNLAVYVSYGTVADENATTYAGSATYMAYGLNALGGSGTTAWTGQVNLGGTGGFLIPITTNWARYGVAVPIPTTALEISVSICYTPVGTGTSTDWFEFAKAQFTNNPAVTAFAGTSGAIYNVNDQRMKAFARRPAAIETLLQQRYTYSIKDSAGATYVYGVGQSFDTTSNAHFVVPFPVTMRIKPTSSVASSSTAFGYTATAGTANDCTGSDFTVISSSATTNSGAVGCSAGSVNIAGGSTLLVGKATPSNATVIWSAEE